MVVPQIRVTSTVFIMVFVFSLLISAIGQPKLFSADLQALHLAADAAAIAAASADYGKMTQPLPPAAVLYPSSVDDIVTMIKSSSAADVPFPIAARGHGHSIHGQAAAPGGVVIDMRSLAGGASPRVNISASPPFFADVGGEQLWIEVLDAALRRGLAPRSWTDYLYLTVGGTLSNGGVSGQVHRHGPQISNVYEMDVVTGVGEVVTCSREVNSDLFYGVLGGLGQFGVITRARIALEQAPERVIWIRLIYDNFSGFTMDQESLISSMDKNTGRFDYVEGFLISDESLINNWRSSFFSPEDRSRIRSITTKRPTVYCLEVAKYYDQTSARTLDQTVKSALEGLSFIPGLLFSNDVTYVDFLDRVHKGELKLRAAGLWDVPHPWLNLFVPKSSIFEFDAGVFRGILRHNSTMGPTLVYPMRRDKWDVKMSTAIPDEEVFYSVGLLRSAANGNWESLERQNREILDFCERGGIRIKQYLPHYQSRQQWENHFGEKWPKFLERKLRFDPKAILSPSQKIFTTLPIDSLDLNQHPSLSTVTSSM